MAPPRIQAFSGTSSPAEKPMASMPPIHRESLVRSRSIGEQPGIYMSMMPTTTDSTTPANRPRSASQSFPRQRPSPAENQAARWSPWMVKFCTEPASDANACCLAFWVPPVSYGKTQARLSQKSFGEDIEDKKATNGFNHSCGTYFALQLIQLECESFQSHLTSYSV